MDQDGANPIFLTDGGYMVLTPRFNPTAQRSPTCPISAAKPRVYLFDIETGRQEMLGNFPDMTFAPRFSPDGNKVAMTLENGGNSDIYVMDLRTRAMPPPDHRSGHRHRALLLARRPQIAFESDRGGSQQIYVMNADGSNQHRISFGAGRNGTPVWVAARRSDRLHQAERRHFHDRRHAPRRLGRAHAHQWLAG